MTGFDSFINEVDFVVFADRNIHPLSWEMRLKIAIDAAQGANLFNFMLKFKLLKTLTFYPSFYGPRLLFLPST